MQIESGPPLFVVITDFNGYEQTRRCLAALGASHYRAFKAVVVDHGTTSETREGLERDFPEVQRLEAPPELWWTGATNRGIRHSLAEGAASIMLLNNDSYVTPDMIGTLIRLAGTRPDAILAPVQRDWISGKVTWARAHSLFLLGFPTLGSPAALPEAWRSRDLVEANLICGGRGALIPAAVFEKNGLFDEEKLPHYWADHDFYLRARSKGISLCTAPAAVVEVDSSRSSMANDPGRLDFMEFLDSLHSIRSHRNVSHVTELFRRHYPWKPLYRVGALLYTARYIVVYAVRRIRRLLAA